MWFNALAGSQHFLTVLRETACAERSLIATAGPGNTSF